MSTPITYDTLFTTIQGYVENDFPSGTFASSTGSGTSSFTAKQQIDTFIQQAEQRIFNSVQFPSLRKNVTASTTAYPANSRAMYLSSPGDFLAPYSLAVIDGSGNYEYLLNKDVNFLRAAYPNPATTGIPKYYALFGPTTTNDSPPVLTNELSFLLAPTPNIVYSIELHYFFYPESITGTDLAPATPTNTTWLGDNFSSALLYGALVEAYTYMKGEADIVAAYNKRYEEAMILAKRLGDGMERRDAYRSGQVRMTVN
jgi:hypothetical protein